MTEQSSSLYLYLCHSSDKKIFLFLWKLPTQFLPM